MGGHKHIMGCLMAASLLWTGAAAAEPETHDGFFMRLGLNFGPLMGTAAFEGGPINSEVDVTGFTSGFDLLLGGTPVDGLVIGGGLIGGYTGSPKYDGNDSENNIILSGIGAFANYYFDPNSGGHIQALLGFAVVDAVSDSGQSGGNDPTGVMLGIGGGYDFWIGDEWSIGPFARVLYAPTSVTEDPVTYKFTYLYPSIGVAFTLH